MAQRAPWITPRGDQPPLPGTMGCNHSSYKTHESPPNNFLDSFRSKSTQCDSATPSSWLSLISSQDQHLSHDSSCYSLSRRLSSQPLEDNYIPSQHSQKYIGESAIAASSLSHSHNLCADITEYPISSIHPVRALVLFYRQPFTQGPCLFSASSTSHPAASRSHELPFGIKGPSSRPVSRAVADTVAKSQTVKATQILTRLLIISRHSSWIKRLHPSRILPSLFRHLVELASASIKKKLSCYTNFSCRRQIYFLEKVPKLQFPRNDRSHSTPFFRDRPALA